NVTGYLAYGVAGWIKNGFELDYIPHITVQDFVELREQEPDRIAVLDVRELGEVGGGAIENSLCIPLGKLKSRFAELDHGNFWWCTVKAAIGAQLPPVFSGVPASATSRT